jgi:hypothetical protein
MHYLTNNLVNGIRLCCFFVVALKKLKINQKFLKGFCFCQQFVLTFLLQKHDLQLLYIYALLMYIYTTACSLNKYLLTVTGNYLTCRKNIVDLLDSLVLVPREPLAPSFSLLPPWNSWVWFCVFSFLCN